MASNKNELFSSVLHYFTKNYEVRSSGKDNIKLGTRSHTPAQFAKRFLSEKDLLAQHVGRQEFYGLMDDLEKEKGWEESRILEYMSDQVFKALKMTVDKATKESITKAGNSDLTQGAFDWSNHLPVIDIKSNQHLMFDNIGKLVDHGAEYGQWKEWVNSRPSEERKVLLSTVTPAVIMYDPRKIEEVQYKARGSQESVLHLNAHKTPEWRREENRLNTPELPTMFLELMDHLFADKESMEYVYAWLYFMLTDRNHCYLLLHGDQGLGKTTFARICSALVGESNYSLIGPEFWESRFNKELKYRRLCFFDETQITPENITSVRALTNKYVRIEEKNVNAVDLENYASHIIANNTDKYNLITYDDRRFSVPNMGKGNIKNTLGEEWLDRFYNTLENNRDFIANIGWWILDNGDRGQYSNTQPFISDTFYDLVDKALTMWQKNIIDVLESKEEDMYLLSALTDELRGTGRVKLGTFLENHRDRNGEQYGYLGQASDGKRYMFASDKYKPQNINFNDQEF